MAFYIYRDHAYAWRWRLKAANHRIIADSGEGYQNKVDCLKAVELVKGSSQASVYDE